MGGSCTRLVIETSGVQIPALAFYLAFKRRHRPVRTVGCYRLPSNVTRSRRDRAVPHGAERRPSRGVSAVGSAGGLPQSERATGREDREHRQSEQDQNQRFRRDGGDQGPSDSSRTTGRPVEAPIGPLVG